MEKTRKHIIFEGRVQGVGFRYYSITFATSVGLTGWVENLENGNVEMEVQGTEEKIDRLIEFLENRRYVIIERMFAESIPLVDKEWTFKERG